VVVEMVAAVERAALELELRYQLPQAPNTPLPLVAAEQEETTITRLEGKVAIQYLVPSHQLEAGVVALMGNLTLQMALLVVLAAVLAAKMTPQQAQAELAILLPQAQAKGIMEEMPLLAMDLELVAVVVQTLPEEAPLVQRVVLVEMALLPAFLDRLLLMLAAAVEYLVEGHLAHQQQVVRVALAVAALLAQAELPIQVVVAVQEDILRRQQAPAAPVSSFLR
jgi:sulfur carrier protein ThiS